jgi:hypothetical protein
VAESKPVIPLKRSQFVCPKCKGEDRQGAFFFFAVAEDIRENERGEFVADCPQCKQEGQELWYCTNLREAMAKNNLNGPISEAGKNKVRMNGFKNGSRYLSGAIPKALPPAKPGEYAECDECQDLEECKQAVADAMGTSRFIACHRQSEVFAKYRNAHLTGDTDALKLTAADNQARMQLVLNALFKAISRHGVVVNSIVVNKDGVVMYGGAPLTELKSNPATNDMIKLAEKMGFSLTDWTLTPKSKEAKAALDGYLAGMASAKGQTMQEFLEKHNKDMKDFQDAIVKGSAAAQQDETLKESQIEEQEATSRGDAESVENNKSA